MWCVNLFTLFTYVILLLSDVVHGKFVFQEDIQRSIGQKKVVATWDEAKKRCENAGAILASPIDEKVLKHMMSYIDVNNHTNSYFIGIKAKYNPKPEFYTTEDVLLNDLPDVVLDMIDTLDPHDGDCLAMNRDSIRVVPCWSRYPYICYTRPKSDEPEETVKPTEAAPVTTVPTTTEAVTETTEAVTETTEAITETTEAVTETTEAVTETTEAVTETTEAVTETTVTQECDYDKYEYYPATGRCYRLDRIGKTWSDANVTCEDEGGYLAIVNDAVKVKTLANIIKKNYMLVSVVWVGRTDVTGKGDRRSIYDDPIDKINHRSDTVRLLAKPKTCSTILIDATLFDQPCEDRLPFVCEKSLCEKIPMRCK